MSPGIGQIPVEPIRTGNRTIRYGIYKIIIYIWNKEKLPEEWKESIIVPIYKKGDETDFSNYRGISILQITYKILSNILFSRLASYAKKIIVVLQCGFRRNMSAANNIFCIRQILEKKWKYKAAGLHMFIEFKKAYDSVRREFLYNILIEFGIPMKLGRLIKMHLNEIYNRFLASKNLSDIFPIKNSVKEGVVYRSCFSTFI